MRFFHAINVILSPRPEKEQSRQNVSKQIRCQLFLDALALDLFSIVAWFTFVFARLSPNDIISFALNLPYSYDKFFNKYEIGCSILD